MELDNVLSDQGIGRRERLFRLVPSMPDTEETDCGSSGRESFPTPACRRGEWEESTEGQQPGTAGNTESVSIICSGYQAAFPTPYGGIGRTTGFAC
jgi:hypothetical protein